MKALIGGAALAAALYGILGVGLYVWQRRLVYFPDASHYTPAQAGLPAVTERRLDTPDGERLIAWYAASAPGRPTLLYYHGNAGGLINRSERIQRFMAEGYGVLMPAYRGYGGSSGAPAEAALHADAVLAYDHLRRLGVAAGDIVGYGESLGTAIAVQLATQRKLAALVLEAPFTSLVDVAKGLYGLFPVDALMTERFSAIDHIGDVGAPLLILHGGRDTVIPVTLGRALFAAAGEPKRMVILPEAGHSDIYTHGAMDHLHAFLSRPGAAAGGRDGAPAGDAPFRAEH